jgi:hypothetical protein
LTDKTTFPNGVPLNMSIPTHGTFYAETLGWAYASQTTRWILIPGTLVALVTISIVVVALHRHVGDIPKESDYFDPSNAVHLVIAAAAGGLHNAFRGLDREEIREGEKLDVVLGCMPGRGFALVRADEYGSVFSDALSPRSANDDTAD